MNGHRDFMFTKQASESLLLKNRSRKPCRHSAHMYIRRKSQGHGTQHPNSYNVLHFHRMPHIHPQIPAISSISCMSIYVWIESCLVWIGQRCCRWDGMGWDGNWTLLMGGFSVAIRGQRVGQIWEDSEAILSDGATGSSMIYPFRLRALEVFCLYSSRSVHSTTASLGAVCGILEALLLQRNGRHRQPKCNV